MDRVFLRQIVTAYRPRMHKLFPVLSAPDAELDSAVADLDRQADEGTPVKRSPFRFSRRSPMLADHKHLR